MDPFASLASRNSLYSLSVVFVQSSLSLTRLTPGLAQLPKATARMNESLPKRGNSPETAS